jgi:membrane protein
MLELTRRMRQIWREEGLTRQSAALTYYALFALSPLVVIVVGIAGRVVGSSAAVGALRDRYALLLGDRAADELATLVQPGTLSEYGVVAAVIGAGVLLYGAGRLFYHLQFVLDSILGVRVSRSAPVTTRTLRRALPFLVVLVAGVLLVLILLAQSLRNRLESTFLGPLIAPEWMPAGVGSFVWTAVIVFGIFLALYATLPNARVPWRSMLLGAGLAALAFAVGQTVFIRYVGWSAGHSTSSAAGSVVLFLLWVHYSAMVLVGGELFAAAHAEWSGARITPASWAVKVSRIVEEPTSPAAEE